ncbi:SEC-C metal-binding domain-containing protein [Pelotomaculum propionicicum]|uniref:YkgJ family cysteine cluster protein n=1 Tax=Pelotomaculum propionicicum TaxID=258475 RepID=UPI003B783389
MKKRQGIKKDPDGLMPCGRLMAGCNVEGRRPMSMVREQPRRNDPCSCGSGRKYKRCCLGAVQEVAFTNYQGRQAYYPVEEARLALDKYMLLLVEAARVRGINEKNALEMLRQLYYLYEGVQKYFSPYYSCQAGCSYCCYPYVGASTLESRLAGEHIESAFSADTRDLFFKKICEHKNDYLSLVETVGAIAGRMQEEYFAKQIPCPFLSDIDTCLIYPVRPLACRALAVISDPEECRLDRVKEHFVPFGINSHAVKAVLALSRRVYGGEAEVKHFPAWFVDGFGKIGIERT